MLQHDLEPCRMKRGPCARISPFTFTSSNMQICQTQSHASTETPNTQSHVTDSAGALSSADNCYHHCTALQWPVTQEASCSCSCTFALKVADTKSWTLPRTKSRESVLHPQTSFIEENTEINDCSWVCVCVCVRDGLLSSQKPQDAFCQNSLTSLSKIW